MPRAKGYRARDYGLELRPADNHAMISKTAHKRAFLTAVSSALLLCLPSTTIADPPNGYYDSVETTDAATLRATLHEVIDDHTQIRYRIGSPNTWDVLELADEDALAAGGDEP